MRLGFLALALSAAVVVSTAAVARQTLSTPAEIEAFARALPACTAAAANTAHPLMKSFVIEHRISGEAAGKCGYSQSMPGKMTMICALGADGRTALAADLKAMAAGGAMSGGTAQKQPAWMSECEIQLPNGTKIPAITPARGGGS